MLETFYFFRSLPKSEFSYEDLSARQKEIEKKKDVYIVYIFTLNVASVQYRDFFHNYIFHFPISLFLSIDLRYFFSHIASSKGIDHGLPCPTFRYLLGEFLFTPLRHSLFAVFLDLHGEGRSL